MFSQKCVLPSTFTTILLILASAFLLSSSIAASAQVTVPLSNHVVLIIDENTSFTTVYPTGMPWLVGEGNKYGYSNNFFSNISGSLLDYLWLAFGRSQVIF